MSPHRYILEDMDGSLTGFQTCGWVIPYYIHNLVTPHCKDRRWDYGGIICDCNVKIRKIKLHGLNPSNPVEIKVIRLQGDTNITTAPVNLYSNIFFQVQWNIPFVLGHTYNIHHRYGINFKHLSFTPSKYYKVDDPITYLRFNYTDERELFEIKARSGCYSNEQLVLT